MHKALWVGIGVFSIASAAFGAYQLSLDKGVNQWRTVLDGVMGGLSTGEVTQASDGSLRFTGILSLENNGGFSQIRTNVPVGAFDDAGAVEFRVKGDGRTYNFDIRTADAPVMAGSFQVEFDTRAGEWMTFRADFEDFRLFSYGRQVRNAPALNPDQIESIGVTLSDKNPGPFRLDIESIRAVPNSELRGERETQNQRETDTASEAEVRELFTLAINRGVPLFNEGNPGACAAVYEVAINAAVNLSPGVLDDAARTILKRSLKDGFAEHDMSERAWIYRRAMDAVLERMMRRADA